MGKKDIIILSSFFDTNLINNLYKSNSSLKNQNYIEQIKIIKKKKYFSRIDLDFYFLKKFSSFEIFVGANYALKKLFEEENIEYKNYEEGIINLINYYKPKIIIFRDIDSFSINKIIKLKNLNNLNFKTVLLNGFPIRNQKMYSLFDCVVFRNPWLINNQNCVKTYLIYHCFNSEILKNISLKRFEDKTKTLILMVHLIVMVFIITKRYYYLYNLISGI